MSNPIQGVTTVLGTLMLVTIFLTSAVGKRFRTLKAWCSTCSLRACRRRS